MRLIFCTFCFIFSLSLAGEPLLPSPSFKILSTEDGLPQNTVMSMLIDKKGYLLIGTENGLSRFDGYRVQNINGTNDELRDVTVNYIFEDSNGNIWFSVENFGLYLLNTQNGKTELILQKEYKHYPGEFQVVEKIIQNQANQLIIAFDEEIISLNIHTKEHERLFKLPNNLLDEDHIIRDVGLFDNSLIIATSAKLLGFDLRNNRLVEIDYLGSKSRNENNLNSKLIFSPNNSKIWIGTVEGLYELDRQQTLAFINNNAMKPEPSIIIPSLNIWDIKPNIEESFYIGTNQGLYLIDKNTGDVEYLFKPSDSRYYISDDDITNIQIDEKHNLWLGTNIDGALYWSPKSTAFYNINTQGKKDKKLSHDNVWSFFQKNNNELWIGTTNGLNKLDLSTGSVDQFLKSDDDKSIVTSSTIDQILPFGEQHLLLNTADGLSLFNIETSSLDNQLNNGSLSDVITWGATVDSDGDIYFPTQSGWFKYELASGKIETIEALNTQLDSAMSYGFLKNSTPSSNTILVSMPNSVYQYDIKTAQVSLVHKLTDTKSKSDIYPDSYVTSNGIIWINYTGFGLVGLDSTTYNEKYVFNKSNGLKTTANYNLEESDTGDLWLSSHSGLISFNPDTLNFKYFTQNEGLLTNEYNSDASIKLNNGQFVYGGIKGLTLFAPNSLTDTLNTSPEVEISKVTINGELLLDNYATVINSNIQLQHDDIGFSLYYSTLRYSEIASTDYKVVVSGSSNIDYPVSNKSNISFPKLQPGNYTISISAKDSTNGIFGNPTILNVSVSYPLWRHPIAYALYLGLIIILFSLWLIKRNARLREITQAHEQTTAVKNKLTLALEATNSGTWEWNSNTREYLTDAYSKLGYRLKDNLPSSIEEHLLLIHSQDRVRVEKYWNALVAGELSKVNIAYRLKAVDDTWHWYKETGSIFRIDEDNIKIIGTTTNITERLVNEEKAKIFGEAFKQTNDFVLIFDSGLKLVTANPAFLDAFKISETPNLSKHFYKLIRDSGNSLSAIYRRMKLLKKGNAYKAQDTLRMLDGRTLDVLVNITTLEASMEIANYEYYLVIISDISEQKAAEENLRRLANYDSLTGLPNRVLLVDRISHALDMANQKDRMLALLFIDLDRFKQVNDSLGHNAGDELLRQIAMRLNNFSSKNDTVARLGGDEFVIMIEDITGISALSAHAQRVIEEIEKPVVIKNQKISVSSSIGIALYPNDAKTSSDLMKNADLAMYHAKGQGRGNFQYFTQEMNERAHLRLELENKIKQAHKNKHFDNFYQPIHDVTLKKTVGYELLLRWTQRDEFISPDVFIPISEEIGLIEDVTMHALINALPVLKCWKEKQHSLYLSINLSGKHFEKQSSTQRIMDLFAAHLIPPNFIRFEITEGVLMMNYDKAKVYMQKIRDNGYSIALDDFGTGYSSLKYLKSFPIQVIKIDRSFVSDIGIDSNDEAIISAVLKMAESLGMSCIAEGIETLAQLEFLLERGCYIQQGYYFSKPINTNQLLDLNYK